jgi:8-amino-7-oxononanoate synthase
MASSLATTKVSFRHNDLDAFREAMISTMDSQPMIQDGSRSILVSVESVYSMDGDVCPLVEMLEIAREICPKKNFAFIADEAHATGIVGPKGVGLVKHLGLEKDIAIRLNTCGKALACTGCENNSFT